MTSVKSPLPAKDDHPDETRHQFASSAIPAFSKEWTWPAKAHQIPGFAIPPKKDKGA